MSHLPKSSNPRELRKAMIRLRMEMHRQEIRHEASHLVSPAQRLRAMSSRWQKSLGVNHAPLWGVGAVLLLGFFTGKGARTGGLGKATRLVRLGTALLPLIRLFIQVPRKPE